MRRQISSRQFAEENDRFHENNHVNKISVSEERYKKSSYFISWTLSF